MPNLFNRRDEETQRLKKLMYKRFAVVKYYTGDQSSIKNKVYKSATQVKLHSNTTAWFKKNRSVSLPLRLNKKSEISLQ
ncbi:hypothetical protein BH10BAC2_BH10BAC2_09600 [soil metagenome]